MKKIFLICPVRNASPEITEQINAYVAARETEGYEVHWPARDTNQDDKHGWEICTTNFRAMQAAGDVHVWYDPTSFGSIWDLGMLYALQRITGFRNVVLANLLEPAVLAEFPAVILRQMVWETSERVLPIPYGKAEKAESLEHLCSATLRLMRAEDEFWVSYDPIYKISVFTVGMLFALHHLEGQRKITLAHPLEATADKSFANVILRMVEQTKDL